ncbi:hypothetical protein [Methylococcus mesophilus]|uniref:hypothetical protein n=1 Tax=Methylococcus mesophilus TaxID=2993564 RepID=UPI00224B4F54|nr:hypothetical protein [Methylococcus mesophilus]UZR30212.1 hypothetical protein OOT43_06100 [Methylococcus mesophilus]
MECRPDDPGYQCPDGYNLIAGSNPPKCSPGSSCPNGGTYDNTTSYCYNVPDCPAGQNRQADCSCAAAGLCEAGAPIGEGSVWQAASYSGLLCVNGCAIRSSDKDQLILIGVSATKNNQPGTTYTGSFVQTGGLCSAPAGAVIASVSKEVDPPKPGTNPPVNCVNDATGKSMCIDRQRPGCGVYNGNKFCGDQLPTNGECFFIGKSGYVCGGNQTPPPPPNPSDPPAQKGGDIKLPGNNTGQPGGGDADGDGNPVGDGPGGDGDQDGNFGNYPGGDNGSGQPDGNGGGNCTGSNCLDTSGLAKETTLSGILGSLNTIKDGIGGSLTGNGFTAAPAEPPSSGGKQAEIEQLRSDLSARIAAIKAELNAMVTFGNGSGALVCGADWGFSFLGSYVSLCNDSVIAALNLLGPGLLFIAVVYAFYVLFS